MPKFILTLLLGIFGFSSIYASFPVTESSNNYEVVISNEETPEDELTKNQKLLWFLMGLLLTYIGVIIAIISQLKTKKKGKIKFALFGFATYLLIVGLLFYMIEGELPFDFDFDMGEIFIFG